MGYLQKAKQSETSVEISRQHHHHHHHYLFNSNVRHMHDKSMQECKKGIDRKYEEQGREIENQKKTKYVYLVIMYILIRTY